MRYFPIDSNLFVLNRKNFAKELQDNSAAIFNANDIMPTNADGVMPFKQNSDLFYLSGIDQEETMLVVTPHHPNKSLREVLFLRETSDLIAVWEGHKFSKKEGEKLSGIPTIYWTNEIENILPQILDAVESVYLNENLHARAENVVETRDTRFKKQFVKEYPSKVIKSAASIMHKLRQVKSSLEVETIQKACDITERAFRRVLDKTTAGLYEFQLEAEITHEFLMNRSRGHAYQPIVAGGGNACVLHYISNDDVLKDGDLILMDFGAEYGNYNADLTRCIPVNGRFSDRQKEVYNAVLRTMRYAASILVVGNTITNYTKQVWTFIEKELIGLGLLSEDEITQQDPEKPALRKYFMHGVSHSLGLDVHDVDNRERAFEPGMVYTIEPGIYIPEENLGIRIENNFVITADGAPIDLMSNIPIEAEEIESLMQGKTR